MIVIHVGLLKEYAATTKMLVFQVEATVSAEGYIAVNTITQLSPLHPAMHLLDNPSIKTVLCENDIPFCPFSNLFRRVVPVRNYRVHCPKNTSDVLALLITRAVNSVKL